MGYLKPGAPDTKIAGYMKPTDPSTNVVGCRAQSANIIATLSFSMGSCHFLVLIKYSF